MRSVVLKLKLLVAVVSVLFCLGGDCWSQEITDVVEVDSVAVGGEVEDPVEVPSVPAPAAGQRPLIQMAILLAMYAIIAQILPTQIKLILMAMGMGMPVIPMMTMMVF